MTRAILWAALALAACADTPRGLLTNTADAPPEIRDACALADTRCARCHPIERVVLARGVGERRWQMFVDEMRRKPSSGISPGDAEIILRCLRFFDDPTAPVAPTSSPAPALDAAKATP